MAQEDRLKREIDMLGKILGKILADLIGLKQQESTEEAMEVTEKAIKKQLNLDITELLTLPTNNIINFLKNEKKYSDLHLEGLADILFELADAKGNQDKKKNLFEKVLIIYEYLNTTNKTYSLEQHFKINKIKNCLM